jgi:hypothetical protein
MNLIAENQNSEQSIQRLAAQRELYSSAKRLYILQLIGNILIPITISVTAMFYSELSVYSALYGIAFFTIDIFLIESSIATRKNKAAKIQELFDCEVLEIRQSPLKTANDIAVEDVLKHYDAHKKIASNIEKIKDWYPKELSALNIAIARIICQRTNSWWDSKLRSNFCNFLLTTCILLLLAIFTFGVIGKVNLETFALIASGLIPFYRFSARQYLDNLTANKRHEKLNGYFTKIWSSILNRSADKSSLEEASRNIQDEIFENRSKSPFILDAFYKIFRNKDEELMKKSAEAYLKEIEKAQINFG